MKLFKPFSRLDNSAKLNPNGIGLGLSNCRRVLESMGSKIWVLGSKERRGSYDKSCGTCIAFTVKLFPRAIPEPKFSSEELDAHTKIFRCFDELGYEHMSIP